MRLALNRTAFVRGVVSMAGLRGLHQHLHCKTSVALPRNPCSILPPPLPCWIAGHPGFAASISTSSCSRVQSRYTDVDARDARPTVLQIADPSDVQQIFLDTSVHIAVPACYLMLGRQPDATQTADLVRHTASTLLTLPFTLTTLFIMLCRALRSP